MRPPLTPLGPPPQQINLEPGGVHLWRVRLRVDFPPLTKGGETLLDLLSPDERARAARLRLPEKAHAFVIGRARLRQILARYLDRSPAELAFTYGPHGKPALAGGESRLQFNLAHSGQWLLLAVADRPVGVDLERIETTLDFAPLAERFLAVTERRQLAQAPAHRRRRTFYRLWTRREAYLKGRGGGFSEEAGAEIATDAWRVENILFRHDHAAALALPWGEIGEIRRWTWKE